MNEPQPAGPAPTPPPALRPPAIEERKRDHLRITLGDDVGFATLTTGLERWRIRPRALPGRDLGAVGLARTVLGRRLAAPLLISCMTGGVGEAGPVNRALAAAAAEHGVALGLGSGRAILESADPAVAAASFAVRDVAPDVLLLANLGAAQLASFGPAACRELLERTGADALVVHLNAVQEAVQPDGDVEFGRVVDHIAALVRDLGAPVVVKEVGFGLAGADVEELVAAGVAAVDVAGAGGTNWARVEGLRDDAAGRVAAAFADWGIPTAEAVTDARAVLAATAPGTVLIGSGGVRDGVDAATLLCLGADVVGIARGFLAAAVAGPAAAVAAVGTVVEQLRIAVWASGAADVGELGRHHLVPVGATGG